MTPEQARDNMARLRYEAKRHREQVRLLKLQMRSLKRRPIGHRDPLRVLELSGAANERALLAIKCERAAKELRVYL